MRKLPKWIDILLIPLINLTIALFLSALVVLYIGEDPMDALSIMIKGAIGSNWIKVGLLPAVLKPILPFDDRSFVGHVRRI